MIYLDFKYIIKNNHMSKINCKTNSPLDKLEQIERGKRIKAIREELYMNKSRLAKEIGISSQFLGLIEEGKGNLVYKSVKKLMDLSGHSSDYILFGLDDNIIKETRVLLNNYSEHQIINGLEMLKDFVKFIRKE